MTSGKLLCTGLCGTAFTGVCCVTPAATLTLAGLGLSAWVGWLDYVLLPAMAVSLALTFYALWRRYAA